MSARPVLGVDVGGTTFTVVLCDADGRVRAASDDAVPVHMPPAAAMKSIAAAARNLAERAGVDVADVSGVGVAVPGSVDVPRGVVRLAPNLPGWRDVPVGEIVADVLGVPAAVEHDVRMAALAEARLGAGRGVASFVCVTVGTGIGARAGARDAAAVFAAAAAGDARSARVLSDAIAALAAGFTVLVNVLNPAVIAVGGGVAAAGAALLDPVRAAVRASAWAPGASVVRVVPAMLGTRAGAIGAALHVVGASRAC